MKRALLILIALAGAAYGAGAPVHVPFVARLADNGMPITGNNHDLVVELYANATGGTAIWSEERNPVPISSDGLVYLELGAVTPFPDGTFDGATKYLQLTIDGQITTTRIPVDSAPYAISANSATTATTATTANDATMLGGKPAGDYQPVVTGATCTMGHFLSSIDPATGAATCMPDSVYTAGTGLVLTGNAFSVDPTKFQARVADACGPNAAIASINQDGTVNCQSVPSYTAGNGLSLSGTQFSIDPTKTQARVGGSCSPGFAIRVIDQTGNVTCEPTGGGGGSSPTPVGGSDANSAVYTSNNTYGDISGDVGPSVTVSIGASGSAIITVTADMAPTAGAQGYMSFSGAGITASDAMALNSSGTTSATFYVTGLSPGTQTITAKYKTNNKNVTLSSRHLVVTPL